MTSNTEIPHIENYHPKKIVLGKVDKKKVTFFLPNGDKFDKICFKTPAMKICFDIDDKKSFEGKVFVKNISLTTEEIGSENNRKRIETLVSKLESTEKYIKRLLPNELKDKIFSKSLWQGKNKDYKPTFKVSMGYDRDGNVRAGVFDSDNKQIDAENIKRGQTVSTILRLDKVWVWNDKIGINWEVEQIKIHDSKADSKADTRSEQADKPHNKMIVKDTEDESDEE